MAYIRCFCATTSRDLETLTFDVWCRPCRR